MSNVCTLWQLLSDQKIEITIPMIQRDYAQGRRGKEHIRSSFLTSIKDCLCNGTELTLDFVYGNTENGRFLPLDGQQRLTTLWLVHWYLAFRLGKLREAGVRETLKRFSYQTRTSSGDFCKELCDKMSKADPQINGVAAYIKRQTWFYAEWLQDPTINAMLRTIGGDFDAMKSQTDYIEGVFNGCEAGPCWENLTTKQKISFKMMVIGTQQLPISDDLYIKMNARGKALTDFENFKADLVSHIQEMTLTKDKLYYAQQLDSNWTDVFWNNRKNEEGFDGSIDSVFFLFINRFILNQHCLQPDVLASHYDASKNPTADTDSTRENIQKIFGILYGAGLGKGKNPNDDSLIEYKDFGIYRPYMTPENLDRLDRIFTNLKDYADTIDDLRLSSLDENEDVEEVTSRAFHFLPFCKGSVLEGTQLKERIYFHAVCLFLEKPQSGRLGDWMRIVRNLTENAMVDNIERMIGCLRFIDALGTHLRKYDWDIDAHLAEIDSAKCPKVISIQWEEELEKAKITNQELKKQVKEAEDYAFFNGAVRFLYTGPDGVDWTRFEEKFQKAKELFKGPNVSVDTIKKFLHMFESFDQLFNEPFYFFTPVGYDRRKCCWKKHILCNQDVVKQVHNLLTGSESIVKEERYLSFLGSRAIQRLCERKNNYKYRCYYSRDYGVHLENAQKEGIYISRSRLKKNKIFLSMVSLNEIQLVEDVDLGNGFLWGKEILFLYNGKQYSWFVEWGGANWIRSDAFSDQKFEWTDDMEKNTLLKKLQTI